MVAVGEPRPIGPELGEALNMLTGHSDTDMREEVGLNHLNIVNHLQDLAMGTVRKPRVTQAHQDAQGDPKQLVMSLLALCKEAEPVLSWRPGSVAQPN